MIEDEEKKEENDHGQAEMNKAIEERLEEKVQSVKVRMREVEEIIDRRRDTSKKIRK